MLRFYISIYIKISPLILRNHVLNTLNVSHKKFSWWMIFFLTFIRNLEKKYIRTFLGRKKKLTEMFKNVKEIDAEVNNNLSCVKKSKYLFFMTSIFILQFILSFFLYRNFSSFTVCILIKICPSLSLYDALWINS